MKMVPDLATWRLIPWLPKTALVFCDVYTEEGLPVDKDPKTALQEHLQGRKLALPRYAVQRTEGEAHDQTFTVECRVDDLGLVAMGSGATRRAAEQSAAEGVLAQLQKTPRTRKP